MRWFLQHCMENKTACISCSDTGHKKHELTANFMLQNAVKNIQKEPIALIDGLLWEP
jgi:hypothetical protein